MKKSLLNIMLFCFFSINAQAFSGHWIAEKNGSNYELFLSVKGDLISGRYCFITNNGNRIDCEDEGETNLQGIIKGKTATISFDSTYGGIGKATLTENSNKIHWHMIDSSPFDDANMVVSKDIIFHDDIEESKK